MNNLFSGKSALLFTLFLLLLPKLSRAQDWSDWSVVYQEKEGAISAGFNLSDQDCYSDRSRSYFRIKSDFNEKVSGTLKFDYVECNGQTQTKSQSFIFEGAGIYQNTDEWISRRPQSAIANLHIEDLKFPDRGQHQPEYSSNNGHVENQHQENYAQQNVSQEHNGNDKGYQQENREHSSQQEQYNQAPLSPGDQVSRDESEKEKQMNDLSRKVAARLSSIDASIAQNQIDMMNAQRQAAFNILSAEVGGPSGHLEICPDCKGTGLIACSHCDGTGIIKCTACNGTGYVQCPACHGTGRFGNMTCTFCNGTGKVVCNVCQGKGGSTCNFCSGVGFTLCQHCQGTGLLFVAGPAAPVAEVANNNYSSHEESSYHSQENGNEHNQTGNNYPGSGSQYNPSHNENEHQHPGENGNSGESMKAEDVVDNFIYRTGGADQWRKIQTVVQEVSEKTHESGYNGRDLNFERNDSLYFKWPDLQRRVEDFSGRPDIQAYDGRDAWEISPGSRNPEPHILHFSEPDLANFNIKALELTDMEHNGTQMQWNGFDNIDGKPTYVLKMTHENGTWEYDYFDKESSLLVYSKFYTPVQGKPDKETDIRYGDYRPVGGLLFPFFTEVDSGFSQEKFYTQDLQINLPLDDWLFRFPGNYGRR